MDFKWKHTERMIIKMAVRWYLAYSLSYRQVEDLLAERGIFVDHTTIHRWVVEYSPLLLKKFHKCKKKINKSWRMDDTASAKLFFRRAFRSSGIPEKVNINKSGSNTAALKALNEGFNSKDKILIRQNKYLNNLVEQDHRFIKKKVKPMLGFFSLKSARATLAGIELHHMLRKGQFKFKSHLPIWDQFISLAG
jgi:putative transposase